jgi:hypothetical protein
MTASQLFRTMESNPVLTFGNYGLIAANVLLAAITAADVNLVAAGLGIAVTLMGNAYKVVEGYFRLRDLLRSRRNPSTSKPGDKA